MLRGHLDDIYAVTASPDGRIISGAADGTIKIWSPQYNTPAPPAPPSDAANATTNADTPTPLKPPPARPVAATAGPALSFTCDATLTTFAGPVLAVAVLSDGRIASTLGDGTMRIWTQNAVPPVTPASAVPESNAGTSNGGGLSINITAASTPVGVPKPTGLHLNINEGWRCTDTVRVSNGYVCALTVLPDGRLATSGEDHTLRLWEERALPTTKGVAFGPIKAGPPAPTELKSLKIGESIASGPANSMRWCLTHTLRGHESTVFSLEVLAVPAPTLQVSSIDPTAAANRLEPLPPRCTPSSTPLHSVSVTVRY